MSKECENCVKENIGCTVIQDMMRDIDNLRKACFWKYSLLACVILLIGILGITITFWQNMLQHPIMLNNMDADSLKDVTTLFNNQFASMLTLLGILMTIFGFILPLINMYYQRQTLKDERETVKHEVDIRLDIVKEQVKDSKKALTAAQEDLRREIAESRSDLADAILSARSSFNEKTNALKEETKKNTDSIEVANKELDKKITYHDELLEKHEMAMAKANGYFMHQLSLSPNIPFFTEIIYLFNALPYFAKCIDNDECKDRLKVCLERIKEIIDNKPLTSKEVTILFADDYPIEDDLSSIESCNKASKEVKALANEILKSLKEKLKESQEENNQRAEKRDE